MDGSMMADFVSLISNVGFPIFACVMMFKSMEKEQENHKAEMSELKDVIAGNNEVLAQLKQLIEDKLK